MCGILFALRQAPPELQQGTQPSEPSQNFDPLFTELQAVTFARGKLTMFSLSPHN